MELSAAERRAHEADEQVIAEGLHTFVEVGRALMRIRDRRSYLLTHSTFGAYVKDRWRFNAAQAYRLMGGAEVVDVLEGAGVEVQPVSANAAYELRKLADDPPKLVEAWTQVLDQHGPRPIARQIARAVRGAASPSSGGERTAPQEGFDAAITEAIERVQRAKGFQRHALSDAAPADVKTWSRQVKQLRTLATDVQRAIDRKL